MESFATIVNGFLATKYCCKALHLGCLLGPGWHLCIDIAQTSLSFLKNCCKTIQTIMLSTVKGELFHSKFFQKPPALSCFHCVKSVQIRNFYWSAFSCMWTKYGDLRSKSPYSVRIQKNMDQKKHRIWTLFTQCSGNMLYLFFWDTRCY